MAETFIDVTQIRQQTRKAVEAERARAEEARKKQRTNINVMLTEAASQGQDFLLIDKLEDQLQRELEQSGYTIGKHPSGAVRIGW